MSALPITAAPSPSLVTVSLPSDIAAFALGMASRAECGQRDEIDASDLTGLILTARQLYDLVYSLRINGDLSSEPAPPMAISAHDGAVHVGMTWAELVSASASHLALVAMRLAGAYGPGGRDSHPFTASITALPITIHRGAAT